MIKIFLIEKNIRHPMGVLRSFSIKNIFYDKMKVFLFSYEELRV